MLQRGMLKFAPALLVAVLIVVSVIRNDLWHDDRSIWADSFGKSPRKARGLNEIGLQLIDEQRYDEAYSVLIRSLQIDPYQPHIYINLGLALEHLGRFDEAVGIYERAIWQMPTDPTAYYNLGVLYYNVRRDKDRAFHYFLKASRLDPNEPDVHEFLSRLYRERGDLARAEAELQLYRKLK